MSGLAEPPPPDEQAANATSIAAPRAAVRTNRIGSPPFPVFPASQAGTRPGRVHGDCCHVASCIPGLVIQYAQRVRTDQCRGRTGSGAFEFRKQRELGKAPQPVVVRVLRPGPSLEAPL